MLHRHTERRSHASQLKSRAAHQHLLVFGQVPPDVKRGRWRRCFSGAGLACALARTAARLLRGVLLLRGASM